MMVGRLVWGPATPLRKTAGAVGCTIKLKLPLVPPGVWTTTVSAPTAWKGICAFTCVGETKISGIGWPFTVMQLLPSAVGTGIWLVARLVGLRFDPYSVINPPGAAADLPSAALTIAEICGGATEAA